MKIFISIILFLFLIACSSNKDTNENQKTADTLTTNQDNSALNEQPTKTIIDFLKWYRKNENNIGGGLINNWRVDPWDSTKFYSVNFEETEKYLSELKSTGFISDKYVDHWREYFKKCDNDFKKNPQNDGPPEGFEFDFIMLGQDYEQELSNVEKATVSKITGTDNQKIIDLKFHTGTILTYELSLIDGKWYIDKIK